MVKAYELGVKSVDDPLGVGIEVVAAFEVAAHEQDDLGVRMIGTRPIEPHPVLVAGALPGLGDFDTGLDAAGPVLWKAGHERFQQPDPTVFRDAVGERLERRVSDGAGYAGGEVAGQRLAVLHSRLSVGERYDEWRRIRSGEADVVIGPRSALFAPLPRLKLIVVDEEHEWTYKQQEMPCYHARDVAIKLGELTGDVELVKNIWNSVDALANTYIWQMLLSF